MGLLATRTGWTDHDLSARTRLTASLSLSLSLALSLFACAKIDDPASGADAAPPGHADAGVDQPDAEPPLGPFSTPVLIAPLSSVGHNDDDPTITGDALELYFNSNRPGGKGSGDIYGSKRTSIGDPWGPPQAVGVLNTASAETAPEVSSDGLTIYFSSNRTGGKGGQDIWMSTRPDRAQPWSAPALVPQLNSTANDYSPVTDGSDTLVAFYSTRDGGDADLFVATRASPADPWGTPVPLAELDTPDSDADPFLSPDALTIYFGRGAPGSLDIYLSARADREGPFGDPRPIAELNTATHQETDPALSSDGRTMVLTSNASGDNEIYESERAPVGH